MLLSIIIPAYNEEINLATTVQNLQTVLRREIIPYQIVLVNDSSSDGTSRVIDSLIEKDKNICSVNRKPPRGFGRAIQSGLEVFHGDALAIVMADSSDAPEDVVKYYRKLIEGYDCVFGSRFITGSTVENYPKMKLILNRIANNIIRIMFMCPFNDLTNPFKAYKREVIDRCQPYRANYFNIELELSLFPLIRKYNIAQVPIGWHGRIHGSSNFSIMTMGMKYLGTLASIYIQFLFVLYGIRKIK